MDVLVFSRLFAVALTLATSAPAAARMPRSNSVRHAFVQMHPCPALGWAGGSCRGFVVDHKEPLCAGGSDAADNMQWQPISEAKEKDRLERAVCSAMRQVR